MNKKELYKEMFNMVKNFYIKFNQDKYFGEMTDKRLILRDKLLNEEVEEYLKAKSNNDKVEMLDGICDMYYIYFGTLLEVLGDNIDKCIELLTRENNDILIKIFEDFKKDFDDVFYEAFKEVHRSNMSKLENGKPIFRKDGKIIKGKNYFRPNLKQFIK